MEPSLPVVNERASAEATAPPPPPKPRSKLFTKKRVWHLIELVVVAAVGAAGKGAWDHWGKKAETPAVVASVSPTISPTISPHFDLHLSPSALVTPAPAPVASDPASAPPSRGKRAKKGHPTAEHQEPKYDLRGSEFKGPTQIGDDNKMFVGVGPAPRHLNEADRKHFLEMVPRGRKVSITAIFQDEEAFRLGLEIRQFLVGEGYDVDEAINSLISTDPTQAGFIDVNTLDPKITRITVLKNKQRG